MCCVPWRSGPASAVDGFETLLASVSREVCAHSWSRTHIHPLTLPLKQWVTASLVWPTPFFEHDTHKHTSNARTLSA